jgi:GNAT superfamily N-acetyltransferase
MRVEIAQETAAVLQEYAAVPAAFNVERVLEIRRASSGRFQLDERPLAAAYVKDYDAVEPPALWATTFDVSNWGWLGARLNDRRVGGAVVAFRTPEVIMLEGRNDLAVLWDIRVASEARRHGVGSALFKAAESWAASKGCRWLKVETQNINVAACRFYAKQGCTLESVDASAYPQLPDEIQLLWYKDLSRRSGIGPA